MTLLVLPNAYADEVLLKDGSRIVGTAVSMESGTLIFETSFAGEISVEWEQVDRITTEKVIEVTRDDKEVFVGKGVEAKNGFLLLETETGYTAEPIPIAHIKKLKQPKPPPRWQFTGRLDLSFSSERGNTDKNKTYLDGQMELKKIPHRFKSAYELKLEKSFGKKTEDKGFFTLSYDRFVSEKWYIFGRGFLERDEFSDLNVLLIGSIGPGYQIWTTDEKNLYVEAGLGYVWEKYTANQVNFNNKDQREYIAAVWAIGFDIWLFNKKVQPFHFNTGTISLEDASVWRIKTQTGIRFPMVYKLYTSLQYNYDWVNSPADDKKKYDEAIMLKLGWEW
jgi:putative salt-induced outer membrane protein YdiY